VGIKPVIFDFFFFLSSGTFFSFGVLKQSQLGRQYFIYHGLGIVVLILGAYFTVGKSFLAPEATAWLIASLLFISIFTFTVTKKSRLALAAFFLGSLSSLGCLVIEITTLHPYPLHNGLIGNAVLSMLFLGFSMNAMLLGHWYLVQPKLSIDELKRVSLILLALIGLRFLFGTYGLYEQIQGKNEAEMLKYLIGGSPGIFVLMRWVWGLVGPAALAYPIWETVKMRSTQSATGLLYIVVLFIVTGEILSLYLASFFGIAM
jgi:hypothetical protein